VLEGLPKKSNRWNLRQRLESTAKSDKYNSLTTRLECGLLGKNLTVRKYILSPPYMPVQIKYLYEVLRIVCIRLLQQLVQIMALQVSEDY
jgi:hypothetical protein